MNRRETRVREYYGYALIAGITVDAARRMTPGFIRDMYMIRVKYDIRINGGKIAKNKMGL
jgi:hypothetical protein